ncbi:MAG: hypothetical protein ACRBBN_14115 [Methyloligellaceae bacterium]
MILSDYSIVLYLLPIIPILAIIYLIIQMRGEGQDGASDKLSKPAVKPKKVIKVSEADEMSAGLKLLEAGELDRADEIFQNILDSATAQEDLFVQCEARYYLAKVNKEMGDLTLACEHWQIARELYETTGDKERIAEIEKDMRENGCPTDWVLNGF